MECSIENKRLVPIIKAVNASVIDSYEDIGKVQQRRMHWAARGVKKLYSESLPRIPEKILVTVNKNFKTATLPLGFDEEIFIGGIDSNFQRVAIGVNVNLVDTTGITGAVTAEVCDKCSQDKTICNQLSVTEDTTLVLINGNGYEETTVKKLYPNGDYYTEITTPYLDISTSNILYKTDKKFVTNFDLLPCGCLDTSSRNIVTMQSYCPDFYCTYFSSNCGGTYNGGYRIFEETNLIQFDKNFPYDRVYIEFYSFLTKVNGQYAVPQVAFETLVEWINFKAIDGLKSISNPDKAWRFKMYTNAKSNMELELGRLSLSSIIKGIEKGPKFNNDISSGWYDCFYSGQVSVPNTASNIDACNSISASTTNNGNMITIINKQTYTLAVKCDGNPGSPVDGQGSYQNLVLVGAVDIAYIIIAKTIETILNGDFTFDPVTGTINRSPNVFVTGDTLIIHYNK